MGKQYDFIVVIPIEMLRIKINAIVEALVVSASMGMIKTNGFSQQKGGGILFGF